MAARLATLGALGAEGTVPKGVQLPLAAFFIVSASLKGTVCSFHPI